MAVFSLVVGIVTLALVVYLFFESLRKDKLTQTFRTETSEQVAQLSKDIKKWGDELSRLLNELGEKNSNSHSKIADSIVGLNALESKLSQLVHSLTNSTGQIPDIASLKTKLSDAQSDLGQLNQDLLVAKDKAKKFEADFNDAHRRILQMEAAEAEQKRKKGIEPVRPDRASIQAATQHAIELAWNMGATPRALLAKKAAEDEGALILKAFDAAGRGEVDAAACIVDPSAFDPFSFHRDQWADTVAAKHTLEFARAAAVEGMRAFGFQVDEPKIKVDAYDQNRHDLRDSIPTDQPELKGKIAEVRRLGLTYNGRIVRPARVVQYAIDYRRASEPILEAKPIAASVPAAITEERVTTVIDAQESTEKRGISEF